MPARSRAKPPGDPAPSAAAAAARPRLFPPLAALLDPTGPWLVPLLLLVVSRVLLALWIPIAAEDAYITFRYARNFASGNGLEFNPGERVMGFTSMPWALWCSLGIAALRDPVLWTRATNLLADALTLILLGQLFVRHAGVVIARCVTFFFAAWIYFAAVSVSGMEMTVFLALIVLTAALADTGRHLLAGFALAGVAWMRPEGLVAGLALVPFVRARGRVVAAVLFGAALAGTWLSFGTVVPQSLFTKARVYGASGPWSGRHWWDWLSPVPMGKWPDIGDTNNLILLTVVMAPAFVLGLRGLTAQRRTPLGGMIAACLVVWLGYAALGVAYFWWYLAVPLAGIMMVASLGFPALAKGRALYISAALVVLGTWVVGPTLYRGRAYGERGFGVISDFLVRSARPGDHVLLEPIGIIGYFAPVRISDEVGLVTPSIVRDRMRGAGWYTDFVNRERPDWLVVRYGVLRTGQAFAGAGAPFRNAVERDSLLARYPRVFPETAEPGDAEMVVLRRTP